MRSRVRRPLLGGRLSSHAPSIPSTGLDSPVSIVLGYSLDHVVHYPVTGDPGRSDVRHHSRTIRADQGRRRRATSGRGASPCSSGASRTCSSRGFPPKAVKVGDKLESFTLSDATGKPVSLDQLVESGPAVIVFYRGGWCPYCNLALRTYQRELLPELAAFGARLVAISPQSPDQSLSTAEKAELDFTVLSDPGSRVARRVGIAFQQADEVLDAQRELGLDLAQVNAEGSTELPRPTVLIVDQDRIVRFVDVQPDYTARTEVADIVAALTDLGTGLA